MTEIRVAVLGCGMMGQEHISYMKGYKEIRVAYICDPHQASIDVALSQIEKSDQPRTVRDEKELLEYVEDIDLLVIATPNHMHAPQLLRWARHPIAILCEKPVAISEKQVHALRSAAPSFRANIWVGMEYRFIPAIQKLIQLLPEVGLVKNISIRENRYPFLDKVGQWNKDVDKSGDTLVEKCCHFFDLFRVLSQSEMKTCVTKVHRGVNWDHYGYGEREDDPTPIIDSAYVLLDFYPPENNHNKNDKFECGGETKYDQDSCAKPSEATYRQQAAMGCLELCMFAEGSRHQEEIIVTGLAGRVEAYMPENKVFFYRRPDHVKWPDRAAPPPTGAKMEEIFDCSNLSDIYPFSDEIPKHSGYHYCSTAVEWYHLIDAIKTKRSGGDFVPQVGLDDGICAVEMGIEAMKCISNHCEAENALRPIVAYSTASSEHLLNLAIGFSLNRTGDKGMSLPSVFEPKEAGLGDIPEEAKEMADQDYF